MAAAQESRAGRLDWLDALRGMAVLFVIYEHISPYLLTDAHNATMTWFPSGRVGVYLFFLVSGYIIPASLEHRGNVRAFLVSRFFRLYPLYLVALIVTLLLSWYGSMPVDPGVKTDVVATVTAQATMLPTMVNVPMILAVTWTLAFEMMFYLLVVSLYTLKLLRGSATVAIAFAVGALILAPLPLLVISGYVGDARTLSIAVLVVAAAGLAAVLSKRKWLVWGGAIVLIALVAGLLVFNEQWVHILDGLPIVATMFAGSAIYRFDHKQIPGWRLALTLAVVAAAEVVTLHDVSPNSSYRYPAGEVVVVSVVFAAGYLWGKRFRTPRALAWVGVISYSVYLLHDIVLLTLGPSIARRVGAAPIYQQLCVVVLVLVLILAVSALTHRFIEVPAQWWGKWVNRRLDARAVPPRHAARPKPLEEPTTASV